MYSRWFESDQVDVLTYFFGHAVISPARLPFSAAYIASLVLTIYFSMVVRIFLQLLGYSNLCHPFYALTVPTVSDLLFPQNPSYIGAIIAAIIQVGALLSYIAAYFPGGIQTLKFAGQMVLRGAGNVLPI
jgi:hypothetical protein